MTKEEAIEWFKNSAFYHKDHEPFNMAISALEQEPCDTIAHFPEDRLEYAIQTLTHKPCDDAISRADALKVASNECQEFRGIYGRIEDGIQKLPPVTPSRRKGNWNWSSLYGNTFVCSECNYRVKDNTDFCPNCGARMVEQESEDKE